MKGRAVSVAHVEYEVLQHLLNEIELTKLKETMAVDSVTEKRFGKGANKVADLIQNMMNRRKHKLPKDHVEYEVKA